MREMPINARRVILSGLLKTSICHSTAKQQAAHNHETEFHAVKVSS